MGAARGWVFMPVAFAPPVVFCMWLANYVSQERQACEKDVRFLRSGSISAYPRGKEIQREWAASWTTTLDTDTWRGGDGKKHP